MQRIGPQRFFLFSFRPPPLSSFLLGLQVLLHLPGTEQEAGHGEVRQGLRPVGSELVQLANQAGGKQAPKSPACGPQRAACTQATASVWPGSVLEMPQLEVIGVRGRG